MKKTITTALVLLFVFIPVYIKKRPLEKVPTMKAPIEKKLPMPAGWKYLNNA